jgi:hypothetical protein
MQVKGGSFIVGQFPRLLMPVPCFPLIQANVVLHMDLNDH